ncbi:polyamine ABC transporter substrate-binding protein [Dongia sedimenti]|uniref:Putrescine-binding periplasmic protein n=1 Tax=Dongia sedimenti TaxID=3064282 RepID=A0ABU0YKS0_9PROT|nr:polyamine ABC transporter substrate-binding protein [Rhodospirillaceae bacterium R-7]
MSRTTAWPRAMACAAALGAGFLLSMLPASAQDKGDAEKLVNVSNWSDYIDMENVKAFEKEYGIKVNYDTYDGDETLEAKLLTGHTGYDVVFPSSNYFARGIRTGLYLKLDRAALSNFNNIDRWILDLLSKQADPGNQYAAPYNYGTNGFTYNVDMVKKRMRDAPVDSLKLIFDPEVLAKFQDCGVSFLDSPEDVIPLALAYLGKNPTSQDDADIKAAVETLMKVRPYIKKFDSAGYLGDLPNGDLCIAMSWSGDYATATQRALDAKIKINLAYTIPQEGTNIWFDAMVVPKDAPHPKNAMLFINFMMRPEVAAANTNVTYYATANMAAMKYVNKEILDDPAIYPDPKVMANGYPSVVRDIEIQKLITREWTRFKTGQ